MGFFATNMIKITDSAGTVKTPSALPLTMDPVNLPWDMQVQGLVPVDVYDCETVGWASPIPQRSDYIVDQATGTKYSMFSTVFVGQNSLQFRVTKYSGATP